MRDSRVQVFRSAVDGLVDSLDAVVRLSRWTGPESKPEPLVTSAAKLVEHLGVASRLSKSRFQGTIAEVTKVDAICAELRRLDSAYLAYMQAMGPTGAPAHSDAVAALESEVTATRSASGAWS